MGNNIQFYYPNEFQYAVISSDDSSNLNNAENMLDMNNKTYAYSEGSDDLTTESWVLTMDSEKDISEAFIINL